MEPQGDPRDYWEGDFRVMHDESGNRVKMHCSTFCSECGASIGGPYDITQHRIKEHPYGYLIIWTATDHLYTQIREAFGSPTEPYKSTQSFRIWEDFEVYWTWEDEYVVAKTEAGALWLRMNMNADDRIQYERSC